MTSPNGVTAFFEIFFKAFKDMRDIGGVRIAAVGPATAAKLRELHLQVDLMPEEALGIKVAAAFKKFETIENLKICLLRAEKANPDLPQALEVVVNGGDPLRHLGSPRGRRRHRLARPAPGR